MICYSRIYCCVFILLILFLTGCQPKVYLMPSPVGLNAESLAFELSQNNKDENLLYTLYSTNRGPYYRLGGDLGYTIFPTDDLQFGFVVHRVGEEGTSWESLRDQSIQKERDEDLLIKQIYVRPRTAYTLNDDVRKTSSKGDGYFDQINTLIERNFDKDILVYVHGANCNFYRATAQGAQVYHFTGHNLLVLTFSWPSAENFLNYITDVNHARKSVPAFARLLEILAAHTNAKNINILAYSAGAQVAIPGLAHLRERNPELSAEELKEKLRIGEVYIAAPDIDFHGFVDHYLKFQNIVGRTTINLNLYDKILAIAAFQNRASRLGRPNRKDITEEEEKILIEASRTHHLDILNVGDSKALKIGGAHDSWYSHPWVSNDLLMLFLLNADPLERGLSENEHKSGTISYLFPENYDEKILNIIEKGREEFLNNIQKE